MKKLYISKKLFFFLTLLVVLGIASNALAFDFTLELDWPVSPGKTELTHESNISEMVKYFYEWGISLGGIAVFFSLIMSGFKYLTSVGNENKMREAKDKISSSLFGLLLLLSSFLILNIINPELTTLRIPDDIGSAIQNLVPIDLSDEPPEISDPCEKVIVYSEANFQGNSFEILPGLTSGDLSSNSKIEGEALSIEIFGFCKAELYSSKNCWWKADLMTTIYTSLADLDSVYLNDPVFCVKNLAGITSSPCDTDCIKCSQEIDCITSTANCVWQENYYLCVQSTCNTNCSECHDFSSCLMSEAESGCVWSPYEICEPEVFY